MIIIIPMILLLMNSHNTFIDKRRTYEKTNTYHIIYNDNHDAYNE